MAGDGWVRWVFAAMFLAASFLYLARLVRARSGERGADASRAVMGLGMLAMLAPWLDPLPRLGWQVVFAGAAACVTARLIRRRVTSSPPPVHTRHEAHLVVGGAAMLYMLSATPAGHHMPAAVDMAATGLALPALAWVFVGYFLVFVVWLGTRLAVAVPAPAQWPVLSVGSPHLLGCTEVVMGIGMSYMLLVML